MCRVSAAITREMLVAKGKVKADSTDLDHSAVSAVSEISGALVVKGRAKAMAIHKVMVRAMLVKRKLRTKSICVRPSTTYRMVITAKV